MRAERRLAAGIIAIALGSTPAMAFEPGQPHVCVPSADGRRFECRDKAALDAPTAPAPAGAPAETSAAVAPPAPADSGAAHTTAATMPSAPERATPGTRALPNYLLQNPARGTPSAANTGASRDAVARPVDPAVEDKRSPINAAPAASRDKAADDRHAPAATSAATGAARVEPVAAPAHAEAPRAAPPATLPAGGAVARSEAFRRLPASRYTVELAKAPGPDAFSALLAALGDVDGTLYIVALRTSGQRTWHLLWSDFASVEAARDARAQLPSNVALTSGWPRRIGPLQAELDTP